MILFRLYRNDNLILSLGYFGVKTIKFLWKCRACIYTAQKWIPRKSDLFNECFPNRQNHELEQIKFNKLHFEYFKLFWASINRAFSSCVMMQCNDCNRSRQILFAIKSILMLIIYNELMLIKSVFAADFSRSGFMRRLWVSWGGTAEN